MSKSEQMRLDAAAMVVGLSWSWAPLQSGLGHDAPEFMIAGAQNNDGQNNVIVSGGRECLQHVSDDAGGTITLATWYKLA